MLAVGGLDAQVPGCLAQEAEPEELAPVGDELGLVPFALYHLWRRRLPRPGLREHPCPGAHSSRLILPDDRILPDGIVNLSCGAGPNDGGRER